MKTRLLTCKRSSWGKVAGPRLSRLAFALTTLLFLVKGTLAAAELPDMRPALIGSGPKSVVNLIDTQNLMKRGQGHAALFFYVLLYPDGHVRYGKIWGETKESQLLRDELKFKLGQARFIPAVYDHRPVFAAFFGTLTFSVIDGKPHLRIFANQEMPELLKESDFIAPQPIHIPNHLYYYANLKNPFGAWATEDKAGMAEMSLTIAATGHITDVHLISVTPSNNPAYGDYALKIMHEATFLPAFRNGKAAASTTHYKMYFVPAFYNLQ